MKIEQATIDDLADILRIEKAGFSEAEAGSSDQYRDRIATIPDTFLVAHDDNNKVVGFVVGPVSESNFINDEMFAKTQPNQPTGGNQMILTIAVDPSVRGQGVGSKLLEAFEEVARTHERKSVALTSLEENVPFYEKNGYSNQGLSDSQHANEKWFNLTKTL